MQEQLFPIKNQPRNQRFLRVGQVRNYRRKAMPVIRKDQAGFFLSNWTTA